MYKLLIVDNEHYIRLGIRNAIDWSSINVEIIGEAADGLSALEVAREAHPDIILLDEPFSNVEPETRMALRKLIKKIHSAYRSTIIFVTHDLSEAFFLADRILVLEEGRLAGLGTPQELQESPPSDLIKDFLLS